MSLSQSRDNAIAVIAINQAKGIGSVIEATQDHVQRLLGDSTEGLEEAFARSLVTVTQCRQILLTIALRDPTPVILREVLNDIKSRIDVK